MRKPILGRPSSPPPVIGIPRAMLFYRYEILWKNFFTALGVTAAYKRRIKPLFFTHRIHRRPL